MAVSSADKSSGSSGSASRSTLREQVRWRCWPGPHYRADAAAIFHIHLLEQGCNLKNHIDAGRLTRAHDGIRPNRVDKAGRRDTD